MSHALPNKLEYLKERSRLLSQIRSFFEKRGFFELDTPVFSHYSNLDSNITLFEAKSSDQDRGFLVSSPEYAMKRLLAAGFPNAYQLSHVFRAGEKSTKHNPEFCMLEWYWLQEPSVSDTDGFLALIKQALDLIKMAIAPHPSHAQVIYHTYFDLFEKYLNFNLKKERIKSEKAAKEACQSYLLSVDPQAPLNDSDPLDTYLSYLISFHIEPKLEEDALHVILDFPASQAALATTFNCDGLELAKRFEIYSGSIELANGYHELRDPLEQRRRLLKEQEIRKKQDLNPGILNNHFIESLATLPACSGVAVGFDRLLMLKTGAACFDDIWPISWQDC